MNKTRPQRPSADNTRKRILTTALRLFIEQGFAGTSMGELAAKAKVNQTLIFHHFGNKNNLWQEVKSSILQNIVVHPLSNEPKSLEQFLREAITQRITIYTNSPVLKRLINWQKLETAHNKHNLTNVPSSLISPSAWKTPIQFLQKKKLIDSDLSAEMIITWLVASINGMLDDDLGLFAHNPKNQHHYIEMLVKSLSRGLAN